MARAVSSFGRIDCLVNNGGGQFPCAAEALSDNGWSAVLDTNLTGTFRMAREAVTTPGGLRDTGGSIVNVICLHEQGFPSMAHTGAARAGVKNLTKSLAVEWANYGIRVNAVAPGIIFSASAEANYSSSSSSSDADAKEDGGGVFAQMLSSKAPVIPFRRLGSVREVSNAICFLLGPGGSYMSGTCLEVDGALNCAGVTGSDVFLRRPAHGKSPREARRARHFPWRETTCFLIFASRTMIACRWLWTAVQHRAAMMTWQCRFASWKQSWPC
jgi:peroxisomal trans-2-enoyl-CoA reductase